MNHPGSLSLTPVDDLSHLGWCYSKLSAVSKSLTLYPFKKSSVFHHSYCLLGWCGVMTKHPACEPKGCQFKSLKGHFINHHRGALLHISLK